MNIRRICESEVADNIPADNEFRAGSNLPNSQRFALCQRIMATTKLGAIQAEAVIDLVLQALRERKGKGT